MNSKMVTEHFSLGEMQCKCGCGRMEMDKGFLCRLENLRLAYGKPLFVISAYRCPTHNATVSTTGQRGPHTAGMAVDIKVSMEDAYWLLLHAMQMGFTGIGIKQHGPLEQRFIHIDDLPVAVYPRPRIWSY